MPMFFIHPYLSRLSTESGCAIDFMHIVNDRGRAGTTILGELAATLRLGHLHLDYNLVTLMERLCEQKVASTSSPLGGGEE